MSQADHTLSWVVFADDWGRHPSTTQHLVAHLPPTDHITWVGSLGLRPPRPTLHDLRRIGERLTQALAPHTTLIGRHPDHLVAPLTLPWHTHRAARAWNRLTLGRALAHVRPGAIALLANPAAALYADLVHPLATLYLRLDDWPTYRGVDPALIAATEPRLLERADLVLAPNAHLLEGAARAAVLPQGVDLHRFTAVPLLPPPTRVLGYWGSIAPWLDQDLIVRVARQNPHWTLELIGRVDTDTSRLALPNIRLRPAVPHAELAAAAAHWRAAWAPFVQGDHIARSSSLKLREYLAAGFPTAATPHAEAESLAVTLTPTADAVTAWLDATNDTAALRQARRASVADQSWHRRAADLRAHALALSRPSP